MTWNGETKSQYKHVGHEISKFVKYLKTFGEAGIVKDKKDGWEGWGQRNNDAVCGVRRWTCWELL